MNRRSLFKLLGGTAAGVAVAKLPERRVLEGDVLPAAGHVEIAASTQPWTERWNTMDMHGSAWKAGPTYVTFGGGTVRLDKHGIRQWDAYDHQWRTIAERET